MGQIQFDSKKTIIQTYNARFDPFISLFILLWLEFMLGGLPE